MKWYLYIQYQQSLVLQVKFLVPRVSGSLAIGITTGLKPELSLHFRRLAQEDYQIDFFQESSVTFIRNPSFFKWRFIK